MCSCIIAMARFFLFGFNFVFVVTGILLIAAGSYIQVNMGPEVAMIGGQYVAAGIVVIVAGVIIFFIAFLGCWGAMKHNAWMLIAYGVLMTIIFIIEVAVVGVTYAYSGKVEDAIKANMNKGLKNYGKPNQEIITAAWDTIQSDFKCCGKQGPSDWKKNPAGSKKCGSATEGCYPKLLKTIRGNAMIVAGVGIAILLVQLIGIIIACSVGIRVHQGHDYV